jgi:hypothetical protein
VLPAAILEFGSLSYLIGDWRMSGTGKLVEYLIPGFATLIVSVPSSIPSGIRTYVLLIRIKTLYPKS